MPVDVPCPSTPSLRRSPSTTGVPVDCVTERCTGYGSLVRLLVRAVLGDDPIDPTRVRPSDVIAFVASLRGRFSPRSLRTVRTALRVTTYATGWAASSTSAMSTFERSSSPVTHGRFGSSTGSFRPAMPPRRFASPRRRPCCLRHRRRSEPQGRRQPVRRCGRRGNLVGTRGA